MRMVTMKRARLRRLPRRGRASGYLRGTRKSGERRVSTRGEYRVHEGRKEWLGRARVTSTFTSPERSVAVDGEQRREPPALFSGEVEREWEGRKS